MTDKKIDEQAILRSVLDGMECIICVNDLENFEILFLNDSIRNLFNIKTSGLGEKCHKLLQGLDEPCTGCPHEQLKKEPDKTIDWEHEERINGKILRKTAKVIDWPDGRKAHLEYAIDITELRQTQKEVVYLQAMAEKIYFDPLTGIYNRRYFIENAERLLNTLSRSKGMLSCMMIDIDFFKKYNDQYGHLKGDECLKNVAQILQSCTTRRDDFIARYGGEEFIVILPNTDEKGARIIAERMIEEVRSSNIPHLENGDEKHITVSIGIVSGMAKYSLSVEDFVRRADEAMYESKGNGRNSYTFKEM
jgi:diguanylate cyclase (GGDEF)-like protein